MSWNVALPDELRGYGTLVVGNVHYTGVRYRIWFLQDVSTGASKAAGIIVANRPVLLAAADGHAHSLRLEDGSHITITVTHYKPGATIADIRASGPVLGLT